MDTITINAEEWKETVRKIDRIAGFIEQYAEQLPADDEECLNLDLLDLPDYYDFG